ncbi:hypothetical protein BDZ97DRAFT_1763462 [Flammula alnicola]|nr:hypothetical protein BDZ97DRAFT_1763462 [Flammula alnicola]
MCSCFFSRVHRAGPLVIDFVGSLPFSLEFYPHDFFCTYSETTGALEEDNDAGFCPGSAVPVSIGRRNAHAPLPTRPQNIVHGIPDGPTDKAYLKKRRAVPEPVL